MGKKLIRLDDDVAEALKTAAFLSLSTLPKQANKILRDHFTIRKPRKRK